MQRNLIQPAVSRAIRESHRPLRRVLPDGRGTGGQPTAEPPDDGGDVSDPRVGSHGTAGGDRMGSLRWDKIRAGEPQQWHLFGDDYPPGFFERPRELTAGNWFHDAHLRLYAMLNLPGVVRCAEIDRGRGPVFMFGSAWVPGLLDAVNVRIPDEKFPERNKRISARRMLSWTNTQAVIVVRQGRIVVEEYPGMDPSQRHHWMSISKLATNVLLGKLVTERALDPRRTVAQYLPEMRGTGYAEFTLQQVADMDAEVTMNEDDYQDPKSPFWDWGRAIGWFADDGRWPGGVKQLLRSLQRLPRRQKTDEVCYTSSSTQVLAWVMERVSGQRTKVMFEREIWQRLGAVANAAVTVDCRGVPFVGGGYMSTLRDLARFGLIWANRGVAPDGTRLFGERWVRENTSGKGLKVFVDWRYHNHSYSHGAGISHQGHSCQTLWVNPQTQTVVAAFSSVLRPNGLDAWSARAHLFTAEAIDRFLIERER